MKWFLNNFENIISTFMTICMVILMFLQVISRYLFKSPINWTEELAIVAFILAVYFGAVGAVFRNQQLRLNILTNFLSEPAKEIVNVICNVFIVIFLVVSMKGMSGLVKKLYASKASLSISGFPKYVVYAAIFFALGIFIIRVIQDAIHSIQKFRRLKEDQSGGEE